MSKQWTEAQKAAIHTRGEDLLVSAAAGSGKTAVLSARVGDFVEQGGTLERLLIVTFTNAAAGEMRVRIARELNQRTSALAKIQEEDPKKAEELRRRCDHLRRQSLTLYKAKICTIDSYGMDLLRRHFSAADLSPDFTVLDENEGASLRGGILKRQMEEYYQTEPEGFREFVTLFGDGTDSRRLERTISDLAEKLQTFCFADQWLETQLTQLREPDFWTKTACATVLPLAEEYAALWEEITAAAPFPKEGEMATLAEENRLLRQLTEELKKNRWDEACRLVQSHTFEKSPTVKADAPREGKLYKAYRDGLKKFLTGSDLFALTEAQCAEDLKSAAPGVAFLLRATAAYRRRIREEMRRRNAFSFDVLAELALNLTVKEYFEDGRFTPSAIAEEESARYDEVLIDEYQDVSDLQDLFFRAVTVREGCRLFAVGDVKQSIYGWRGSNPQNFLEKKKTFRVISLNKNFRSRKGILDFCNFLFRGLFSPEVGGFEYDEEEALHPGRGEDGANPYPPDYETLLPLYSETYPPKAMTPEPECELLLLPSKAASGGHYTEEQNRQTAHLCAKLIRDAMEAKAPVFDKDVDTLRPLRYSDIALLLRTNATTELYEQVFREWGIPLLTAGGESFLKTPEVQGILAFLQAVNNPWKDTELFIALTGSVFSFTPEQVANIRLLAPKSPLWEGLQVAAQGDEKANNAVKTLEKFRILAENLPIPKLLWKIYTTTDYPALESREDPRARTNLMTFYSFACGYSGMGGLSGFLTFALRASESEGVKATGRAPGGDFVQLMTIHKSKGLEYAWCILPELERPPKNDTDKTKIDRIYGVASKVKNADGTAEFTTLMQEIISRGKKADEAAESLRLLYVALTRPRDRLTMICRISSSEKEWADYGLRLRDGKLRLIDRSKPAAARHWILSRVSAHPDGGILASPRTEEEETEGRLRVSLVTPPDGAETPEVTQLPSCGLTREELAARFAPPYHNYLSAVPAKVSVTEIAKSPADPDSELLLQDTPLSRPKFLDGTAQTGAERGTALHTYCQFADFSGDLEGEILRLTQSGHLSEIAAKGLNRPQLQAFLDSDLAQSLSRAVTYDREVRFTCPVPVSDYTKNPGYKGELLLQGAMDLLIEEEDGYVIVDFKSDKTDETTLISRYSRQLKLYAAAVNRLYEKPVKRCLIWSFSLKKAIPVCEGEL